LWGKLIVEVYKRRRQERGGERRSETRWKEREGKNRKERGRRKRERGLESATYINYLCREGKG
jgi:hypothetical protein